VQDVDQPLPPLTVNADGKAFWQWEFSQPGANYLRVQFQPTGFEGADVAASLSFWNQSGRLVRRLTLQDLQKDKLQWSDAVQGDYVLVTLRVQNPRPETGIDIKRVAIQNETSAALSIVGGKDDTENIILYKDFPLVWNLQSPIARLLLIQNDLTASCTGFMVSESLMLTNYHCVRSQVECDDMKVQFNYYVSEIGRTEEVSQRDCLAFDPQFANETLDYAFIEIDRDPGAQFGYVPLEIVANEGDGPAASGSAILIIQHPAGLPKKVARTNCRIAQLPVDGFAPETDFSHSCDTMGGSSGSPVFTDDGILVGLHHYGFAEGGIWSDNRAIRMSRIVANLAERGISIDHWPAHETDAGSGKTENGQ
jgi:hypothetical protein